MLIDRASIKDVDTPLVVVHKLNTDPVTGSVTGEAYTIECYDYLLSEREREELLCDTIEKKAFEEGYVPVYIYNSKGFLLVVDKALFPTCVTSVEETMNVDTSS